MQIAEENHIYKSDVAVEDAERANKLTEKFSSDEVSS